jgi:hypothetical protein
MAESVELLIGIFEGVDCEVGSFERTVDVVESLDTDEIL